MSRNSLVDLFSEANIVHIINLRSWKNNIFQKNKLTKGFYDEEYFIISDEATEPCDISFSAM